MKLYTEEQVMKAFQRGSIYASVLNPTSMGEYNKYVQDTFNSLTPIELPSDEEIEETFTFYPQMIEGAKWMRDKILNQTK